MAVFVESEVLMYKMEQAAAEMSDEDAFAYLRERAEILAARMNGWYEGRRQKFNGPILDVWGEDEVLFIVAASPKRILRLLALAGQ